jgi:hypothetical protein
MAAVRTNAKVHVKAKLPCCARPHQAMLRADGTLELRDIDTSDAEDGHAGAIVPAANVPVMLPVIAGKHVPCITCLREDVDANASGVWIRLTSDGTMAKSSYADALYDVLAPHTGNVQARTNIRTADGMECDVGDEGHDIASGGAGEGCLDDAQVFTAQLAERPLAQYQDFYKVVYVVNAQDIARPRAKPHMALAVLSTVALLTIRTRVGMTHIFQNGADDCEESCGAGPGALTTARSGMLGSGKFEVAYNSLQKHAQYALDEGLVVAARFLDMNWRAAQACADEYRTGNKVLVPQMCVHNTDLPMMVYEVGNVVRVPDAGEPGLNECVRGIHVHITESDALQHARSMSLALNEDETTSILAQTPIPAIHDEPMGPLKWFAWNCRPTPWNDDKDTTCLSCMVPMNYSSKRYAVMDCGHGYMCAQCAHVASETMVCPDCSMKALRISACPW